MISELTIIMLCAVVVAVDPARRLYGEITNWLERRANHKLWLERNE